MSIKEEIGMKDLWVRDGFKISDEKVNEDGTLEYKISNKNRLEDDAAECKTPAFKKKSFFRRLIEKWWGKCLE